nr:ribonuclease H-like domain-containing protein [Tanacetum cinerariifolium]
MQKRRNDVKARTTLLLALPDEHQLRFSKYKTAQELWIVILKTFSGNEATKKMKKNLLKQQYGNFKVEGSETLEQTFNRLKVIVSQLEFMDIEIKQDDLNQNIPTASTQVSPAGLNVATASISPDTACVYIASQSNGSQIKYEDINQIDEDDIEKMDMKWNMAFLSMRANRFWKKTGKKISIQGTDVAGLHNGRVTLDGFITVAVFRVLTCSLALGTWHGRTYRCASTKQEEKYIDTINVGPTF